MADNDRLFTMLLMYAVFIILFGIAFAGEIAHNQELWKIYLFQWFVCFVGFAKLLNDKREKDERKRD